jgi:hypothetical protein
MNRKPQLIAYTVKNRERGKTAIWTKIGAAWPHADKPGFSIELDAFPVDGRIVLVEPKADSQPEASASETFESAAGDA